MSLKKQLVVIGTIFVCISLVWGCGNGNNNTSRSAVDQPNHNEQAQSWGDPKRLEASHLEALERMEKDHIHRMVSLSVSTDEDQVMTTLERSSQKLEEMRPLAEMLQYDGHPALLQRIQEMSGDIEGSKNAVAEMKSKPQSGKIKIQSAKTDALQHINSFRDYHEYVQGQVKMMNK
ncbi:hypothetical protein [Paenibacillus silvae]|uniref:hypothetical protein n=1 Tax=Paenibacillus TaxID=44249 RepID=UPI002004BD68|nr:hypothetical protein [Paenibacillus silvae]MCK6077924.1 hypothetical protein [Paenibacillus silvae]MCK6152123.1 hypothetical protein [Paenibacillus silvae]MCK6270808.1 hypothetical protein [Paenibacillus silvae]